jgi:hypothetical protein
MMEKGNRQSRNRLVLFLPGGPENRHFGGTEQKK